MAPLRTLFERFEQATVRPDSVGEDRHRRAYLALCVLFFVPIFLLFGVEDLVHGRRVEGSVILISGAVLVASFWVVRRARDIRMGHRLIAAMVMLFLTFETAAGGGEGFAFLWFYFFPAALFYVLGAKEGVVWVGISLLLSAPLLLTDLGYSYPPAQSLRFLLTYIVVAVLAFGLELSRARLFAQVQTEAHRLEEALSQVKTLSGMLPVCAWCKNVRDDEGYWTGIERYVAQHSDAVLSHGMCPECEAKMFEESRRKLGEEGPPTDE